MQAIRVLRAQSRPASPSPSPPLSTDSVQSGRNGTGSGLSGMTSVEDSSVQQRSTPLSRFQNLTPFGAKRSASLPLTPIPTTIVQDGAYLNTLSLKLNEAATKALATAPGSGPDSFKGRKPLPAGRGRYFASLVETELDASQSNPNLRPAILRLLPRSLSVIVASLSTQTFTMMATPGFVPSSVTMALHPSTVHALALAQFIAELLETFSTYKLGKATPELGVIRTNLEAIISRLTGPILSQVQSEMGGLLEQLGNLPTEYGKPNPAVIALGQYMPSFSRAVKRCTFSECNGNQNMLATFLINTVWQALVNLAHRSPPRASASTTPTASGPSTPSPSPKFIGLSPLVKASGLTPPSSPPKKKRSLALQDGSPQILPHRLRRMPSSTDSSRSVSPAPGLDAARSAQIGIGIGGGAGGAVSTANGVNPSPLWMLWLTSLAADSRAVYELLSDNELGLGAVRPVEGSLPREAVDEALERFAAFKDWLSSYSGLRLIDTVPEEVPILIALPVILTEAWSERRQFAQLAPIDPNATVTALSQTTRIEDVSGSGSGSASSSSSASTSIYSGMAKLVGYESEDVYRRCVLSGFGKADEWAVPVSRCVLDRLRTSSSASASTSSTTSTGSTASTSTAFSAPSLSNGEWSTRVIKWLEERVDGDVEMAA